MNRSAILKSIALVSASAFIASASQAQEIRIVNNSGARYVTTMGSSEIVTAPDQVMVTVGVANADKSLRVAYSDNSKRAKSVLELKDKYHIESNDIQTTELEVEPTYPDPSLPMHSQVAKPTGYSVHQLITFLIHDVEKLPSFLADSFEAGANSVQNVKFEISTSRALKDQARSRAIQAAKEKAAAVAEKLNSKLGKAIVVKDLGSNLETSASNFWMQNRPQYNDTYAGSSQYSDFGGSTAPGSLKVVSLVSVTFEMTD